MGWEGKEGKGCLAIKWGKSINSEAQPGMYSDEAHFGPKTPIFVDLWVFLAFCHFWAISGHFWGSRGSGRHLL